MAPFQTKAMAVPRSWAAAIALRAALVVALSSASAAQPTTCNGVAEDALCKGLKAVCGNNDILVAIPAGYV